MNTSNELSCGVWQLSLGEPETITPIALRAFAPHETPSDAALSFPFDAQSIVSRRTTRGFTLELPMQADEQIYGFGLQLMSFNQTGKKKTLRVNSDPCVDLGDSHAPVPFYVSTAGYAVLVDTARYVTFDANSISKKRDRRQEQNSESSQVATSHSTLYQMQLPKAGQMTIELPAAHGATIYIFGGPTMREAVARYNRWSGGGALPPRWGLGVWYRCRADFNADQVLEFADNFRREEIPCDVLGLEPGWQTHSYSCSFVWSDGFPDPRAMMKQLRAQHFHINLWTHAFVHPASPIYSALWPHSGDNEVFIKGLAPDFTVPEARKAFADFHETTHVDAGASGYKLDECDHSEFLATPWSFPESTQFPSGLDGEQMHSLLGTLYMDTIGQIFRKKNRRTFGQVRNAHALAAPHPFVLYSDLYDHAQFIRGVANCGFSGLLWCPEVRDCVDETDLLRRLQTVVLSPQALINAWYIKHPPWKQWHTAANNNDDLLPDAACLTNACREILQLRMRLLPYLYSAFHEYARSGIPPFRALVMDDPGDANTWNIDDQYWIGDRLIAAPLTAKSSTREIYLPRGAWFDFHTHEKFEGGHAFSYQAPLSRAPLFARDGAVLPLAVATTSTGDVRSLDLEVQIFGDGALPITLWEDDGETFDFQNGAVNELLLEWRDGALHETRIGNYHGARYRVVKTSGANRSE